MFTTQATELVVRTSVHDSPRKLQHQLLKNFTAKKYMSDLSLRLESYAAISEKEQSVFVEQEDYEN